MHCSSLRAYLVELHVLHDPACICGFENEDNDHFFLHCPLYHEGRLKLMNHVNRFSTFELDILLFGDNNLDVETNCKIFQAVHEYITDSKRFT